MRCGHRGEALVLPAARCSSGCFGQPLGEVVSGGAQSVAEVGADQ